MRHREQDKRADRLLIHEHATLLGDASVSWAVL